MLKSVFEVLIRREDTSLRQKSKVKRAKRVDENSSFNP